MTSYGRTDPMEGTQVKGDGNLLACKICQRIYCLGMNFNYKSKI